MTGDGLLGDRAERVMVLGLPLKAWAQNEFELKLRVRFGGLTTATEIVCVLVQPLSCVLRV